METSSIESSGMKQIEQPQTEPHEPGPLPAESTGDRYQDLINDAGRILDALQIDPNKLGNKAKARIQSLRDEYKRAREAGNWPRFYEMVDRWLFLIQVEWERAQNPSIWCPIHGQDKKVQIRPEACKWHRDLRDPRCEGCDRAPGFKAPTEPEPGVICFDCSWFKGRVDGCSRTTPECPKDPDFKWSESSPAKFWGISGPRTTPPRAVGIAEPLPRQRKCPDFPAELKVCGNCEHGRIYDCPSGKGIWCLSPNQREIHNNNGSCKHFVPEDGGLEVPRLTDSKDSLPMRELKCGDCQHLKPWSEKHPVTKWSFRRCEVKNDGRYPLHPACKRLVLAT